MESIGDAQGFSGNNPYYPEQKFQCWDTDRINSVMKDQVE